jgi:hypothetical protein
LLSQKIELNIAKNKVQKIMNVQARTRYGQIIFPNQDTFVGRSVKNYGDFLRIVQELLPDTAIVSDTSWGLKNEKRSREDFDSIITIVERINTDPIYKHLNIVTIDKNGVEIVGKVDALEAIKDFETELVKSLQKEGAAYVQFKHFGSINVGELTFTIDLRNSEVTPQFSA